MESATKADSADLIDTKKSIDSLKKELRILAGKVADIAESGAKLGSMKETVDVISSKASRIDALKDSLDLIKGQMESAAAKADSAELANVKSTKFVTGKMDKMRTDIATLTRRADATAFVGEGLKSVQEEFAEFKSNMVSRSEAISEKIVSTTEALQRQESIAADFHKKSEFLFKSMDDIRDSVARMANESSTEVTLLLRLSEYQSTIRMNAESKYGDLSVIEEMTAQTREIVNLFEKGSIIKPESVRGVGLPLDVKRWAVGKILDCADRWEIRFADVHDIMTRILGKDMVREVVRTQQIRDIYGVRAVNEFKADLGLS